MNDYFESLRVKNWIVVSLLGLLIVFDIALSVLNMVGRYTKRRNKRMKKMAKALLYNQNLKAQIQ
jgi:hypothetical protein